MDPITIDLTSVAGIVATTIVLVHYLKDWLASVPYLKRIPIAVYVVAVSLGLTLLAHDVLHWLEGDRVELLKQALLQALTATGVVEWFRAGGKPLEDTNVAQAAIERRTEDTRRNRLYLVPILLALGLSASACASTGTLLVNTERSLHATIAGADDAINAACDAKLRSETDCQAFNAAIAAAWSAYEIYNKAAQEGSIAGVPAMLNAVGELRAALVSARPQAEALIVDLTKLYDALRALLPKEAGDGIEG